MIKLQSKIPSNEVHKKIGIKINSHLIGLDKNKSEHRQKILELCQIGKLIGCYFDDFNIVQTREKPDFIISNGQESIGLEHQLILDIKAKAKEGFYENICEKVEENLTKDLSLPNFLINLYLKDDLSFKINDKKDLIEKMTEFVKEFVLTGELIENDLITDAYIMEHSQKSVNPNFGAYMQKIITKELIYEYILKKERKISTYKLNTRLPQWLVLIIGGVGESSFKMNTQIDLDIKTNFDKIFLYEDFANNLYQLK